MLDFPFAFAAAGSVAHVLLPAAGAGVCMTVKDAKSASYAAGACLALSGAAGVAALIHFVGGGEALVSAAGGSPAAFRLDGAAALTIALSALGCAVSLGTDAAPRPRTCAALLLAHAAVAAAALTLDLFTAALYLTVHAAALSVLAAAARGREALPAALNGALTRHAGNAFLLFGAGVMFLYGGHTSVLTVQAAESLPPLTPAFLTGTGLAAAGLWLRSGLPPAGDGGAETAVQGGPEGLNAFRLPVLLCLWRLIYGLHAQGAAPLFAEALLIGGTAAAGLAAFESVRGPDVGRSVGHWAQGLAGTAVALSAAGTPEAMSAAFLCLLHTALLSPALFAACACVRSAAGGAERLKGWRGTASYAPASALLLLAGTMMAAGAPGGAGASLWRLAVTEWTAGRYAAALALAAPQAGAAVLTVRLWLSVRPVRRAAPPLSDDGTPFPRAAFAAALALLTLEAALYVIPASAERLADAAARALF